MGLIGGLLGSLLGSGLDIAGAGLLGRQSQGQVGGSIGKEIGSLLPFEQGAKVKTRKRTKNKSTKSKSTKSKSNKKGKKK